MYDEPVGRLGRLGASRVEAGRVTTVAQVDSVDVAIS